MHMYTNTHTLMHRSSVMGMEERGGVEEETEFDVMWFCLVNAGNYGAN